MLQIDGTPGSQPGRSGGAGVIVRDSDGAVLRWHCAQIAAQTCNEAEYQALITGLALVVREFPGAHVRCLSDSRLVVEQMQGHAAVRVAALADLHGQALRLARACGSVRYVAIPRGWNRLADALAWEAQGGRRRLGRIAHE